MTKYPYSYTITTKAGLIITNRMNAGKEVNASSMLNARKILSFYYPGCKIVDLKTKTKQRFDSSIGQIGSAIFLQ